MVKFPANLEFLAEQALVERVCAVLFLECLEHAEFPFAGRPEQHAGAGLGLVNALEFADRSHAAGRICEEK